MARKIILAAAAGVLALAASACNTVSGAGQDLQSASDAVAEEI